MRAGRWRFGLGLRSRRAVARGSLLLLALDASIIAGTAFGATALRFDGRVPAEYLNTVLLFALLAVPVKVATLGSFKLYNLDWRYVGAYDLLNVGRACLISTAVLGALSFLILRSPALPRSILLIDLVLALVGFGAVRAGPRAARALRGSRRTGTRSVLVVGAGEAGASLVRDIQGSGNDLQVVGLVDDDDAKRGTYIHGVRVLGGRSILPKVLGSGQVDEVLIAMPSASGAVIQETVGRVRRSGVSSIRIVPDLDAVLSGRVTTSNVRAVRVEDLLNRVPPDLDPERLGPVLGGATVIVTGAAGSIGSELCRHLARLPAGDLVLLDHNESGIFDLERELVRLPDAPAVHAVVGDVREGSNVRRVFDRFRPDVVFHSAAYKHVPLMELHPAEAVRTNTLGTLLMASEAAAHDAGWFVLISTDKAVDPSSVMGATKRMAELLVTNLFGGSASTFVTLRFGNVLGSRGSLVPVLEDQIRGGGPLTITDPGMERYFMTSTEAVFLILNGLLEGRGGDILVLDMGEPINLLDLAHAVVRMAGLEPDVDIPVTFVGARPGERQRERLVGRDERSEPTGNPRIHRVVGGRAFGADALLDGVGALRAAADDPDPEAVRTVLREVVPTYDPAGPRQGAPGRGRPAEPLLSPALAAEPEPVGPAG